MKGALTMRKLVVASLVTLDGYVAGPGGNPMVLPMDHFFDAHNLDRLRVADTLLLGATTYSGFRSYWPPVAQDPTVSPAVQQDPSVADVHREIGQRNDAIAKVVVSDSLTEADTAPWTDTTTIVRRADAHDAVRALKEQEGGDILVFGSGTLWNDLLTAGLVDELHLMLGGVVGEGVRAFDSTPELRLTDVERREGSDNVVHRYEVVK
jgi:dihydrofolate reductase